MLLFMLFAFADGVLGMWCLHIDRWGIGLFDLAVGAHAWRNARIAYLRSRR